VPFLGSEKKSKICRIVGILLSVAALVLLAVSFFSFMNITKAFLTDQYWGCEDTHIPPTYENRNCLKLLGSDDGTGFGITAVGYEWKPDVGWWLLLGAIFVSSFMVGGSFASNR